MREDLRTAIYARVSSEQQAGDSTIASQIAALEARVSADGLVLVPNCRFVDDGYSGATLVRPALERLRDLAAFGALDRVYVHSPDRLARRYAYQVLLVDELRRAGVEIVFLNRQIGVSPEDDLLLQVQGMVAEYERAKILERSRRGKRHGARRGLVNVLTGAPYGYRYLGKHEGGGVARYEIVEEQARVVRQIFDWVGRDRASIGEVCRRLRQHRRGVPAPAPAGLPDPQRQARLGPQDDLEPAQEPRLRGRGGFRQDARRASAGPATADTRQQRAAASRPGALRRA